MFHYKVIRLSPKDVPLISALREPKRLSNKNVIIIVWCPALNANDMNCGGGGGRVVEALCKQTEGSQMKSESLFGSFVWEMRVADFSMRAAGSCGSLVPEVDPTTGEMHAFPCNFNKHSRPGDQKVAGVLCVQRCYYASLDHNQWLCCPRSPTSLSILTSETSDINKKCSSTQLPLIFYSILGSQEMIVLLKSQ